MKITDPAVVIMLAEFGFMMVSAGSIYMEWPQEIFECGMGLALMLLGMSGVMLAYDFFRAYNGED